MPTKQQAIDFAKQFKWTGKDAERAFTNIDLQNANDDALLLALVRFAGSELAERQRLQGAQKAQVTKKTKYIKQIETEFADKVQEYEETLQKERSTFVDIIDGIYRIARRFGLKDPWIETLLFQYEKYKGKPIEIKLKSYDSYQNNEILKSETQEKARNIEL